MKPHDHDYIEAQEYNEAALLGCVIAVIVVAITIVGTIGSWYYFYSKVG
jgi:hypothetical protein